VFFVSAALPRDNAVETRMKIFPRKNKKFSTHRKHHNALVCQGETSIG
jgi:hypothetical protein